MDKVCIQGHWQWPTAGAARTSWQPHQEDAMQLTTRIPMQDTGVAAGCAAAGDEGSRDFKTLDVRSK